MKTLKFIVMLSILCTAFTTNAQILKQLGNKAKKAAEKTLERKVEQKTERETNKVFDSTFNKKRTKTNNKSSQETSNLDAALTSSYSFSHKYVMQIKDGKRNTDLEYYLSPTGNYFATVVSNKKGNSLTTTVMDLSNNKMHLFMNNNGDKTRMSMALNLNKSVKHAIDETQVNITPTGSTKTILGYECDGYTIKGDTVEGTVWVTQSTGISFAKAFYKTDPSKSNDAIWKKIGKGLTLEMNMVDTSRRKPKSINMTCVELSETSFTINTKDYKKLM